MTMPRKLKTQEAATTYCRSYLVTLGLAFVVPGILILLQIIPAIAIWPWWGLAVLAAVSFCGVGLIVFGLFGPSSQMGKMADAASRHEASLVIMALAYPVYLVLAPFYNRR